MCSLSHWEAWCHAVPEPQEMVTVLGCSFLVGTIPLQAICPP